MSRVCAYVGCPHLKPCPRPEHQPRDRNQPRSRDRDRAKQHAFRNAVLHRDGNRCVKCGATDDLVAHHVKPGYAPDCGITLCREHHKEIDRHAR